MQVIGGQAVAGQTADGFHILTLDPATHLKWDDFSIGQGMKVEFHQPSESSYVLNQVSGPMRSDILGTLLSNGAVYIVNPNGVYVGEGAKISVAGFIASTADLFRDEATRDLCFKNAGPGAIVNLGKIEAKSGDLYLFARKVENHGTLEAKNGHVGAAAGAELLIRPNGSRRIFIKLDDTQNQEDGTALENSGKIEALTTELAAASNIYQLAIKQSGQITALSTFEKNGEIYLTTENGATGGKIEQSGSLTAPNGTIHLLGKQIWLEKESKIDLSSPLGGGTLLAGGDRAGGNGIPRAHIIYSAEGSTIHADGLANSSGGKVILWGDEANFFVGNITARGGDLGGDGGFVEISSPAALIMHDNGRVNTTAPLGNVGTLLLDPTDVLISSGTDSPPSTGFGPGYAFATQGGVLINTTTLTNFLKTTDVIIDATAGTGGTGNIRVTAPLDWASTTGTGTTLTLKSPTAISILENVSSASPTAPAIGKFALTLDSPTINIGTSNVPGDIAGRHAISVGTTFGNILFTSTTGPAIAVNIIGGNNGPSGSYSTVTAFDGSSPSTSTGTITINHGDLNITSKPLAADSNAAAYIEAGYINLNIKNLTLSAGDQAAASNTGVSIKATNTTGTISATVSGDINLKGGTGLNGAAEILSSGEISLNGFKACTLQGGSGTDSHSLINTSEGAGPITLTGGSLSLTAGTGGNASINSVTTTNITLTGDAILTGAQGAPVTTLGATTALTMNLGGNLKLTSPTATNTYLNAPSGISVSSKGSLTMGPGTHILAGDGPIDLLFDVDATLTGPGTIIEAGGTGNKLRLVVDYGNGVNGKSGDAFLQIGSGVTLTSTGSLVQLFKSSEQLDKLPAGTLINGIAYAPSNGKATNQEQWGMFYPATSFTTGGPGFSIFYGSKAVPDIIIYTVTSLPGFQFFYRNHLFGLHMDALQPYNFFYRKTGPSTAPAGTMTSFDLAK